MLKKYRHNPPHLFLDNQVYFITAACYEKRHLLKNDKIKRYLLDTLFDFADRINWKFDNWVILGNHYHFSIKSKKGSDYFKHLNYMLYNPIKHRCVEDLKDYPWSSFHALFDELGREQLTQQFRCYGYRDLRIDFEEEDDF